jgi:hypothetical protein
MSDIDERALGQRWGHMIGRACLDERQRRLWAASEALSHGRGGIAAVARVTGLAPSTVRDGIKDLRSDEQWRAGQQRRAGAGRPSLVDGDETLVEDLEGLLEPATRGDPESLLKCTNKSAATLARELQALGHEIVDRSVLRLSDQLGFTMQANRKTREGADHPDRDAQFRYIDQVAKAAIAAKQPVISVDTLCRRRLRTQVRPLPEAALPWRGQGSGAGKPRDARRRALDQAARDAQGRHARTPAAGEHASRCATGRSDRAAALRPGGGPRRARRSARVVSL